MNRWLPFEWITAVRFLREGRLQTMFIIGGIAIGVGVIVFMSAMPVSYTHLTLPTNREV